MKIDYKTWTEQGKPKHITQTVDLEWVPNPVEAGFIDELTFYKEQFEANLKTREKFWTPLLSALLSKMGKNGGAWELDGKSLQPILKWINRDTTTSTH